MSTNIMASSSSRGADSIVSKVLADKIREQLVIKCSRLQLLDVVDDVVIQWSKEDSCLRAQVLDPPDSKVQVRSGLA